MNELLRSALRILALFPHEDAARPLRSFRGLLLAAGLPGARSFPLCAPLAVLLRPLTKDELASIAEAIRMAARGTNEKGRIVADAPYLEASDTPLPPYLGLPLSIPAPRNVPCDAVLSVCARPALVLAVLGGEPRTSHTLPPLPALQGPAVFRAAYLANLVIAPADNGNPCFSFEWEIGEPRWLPGGAR